MNNNKAIAKLDELIQLRTMMGADPLEIKMINQIINLLKEA
jgi:hypothetical protein